MKQKPTTDIEVAREAARSAYWGIHYHERELAEAHKQVALARALKKRVGIEFTDKEALEIYEDDEDGEGLTTSEDLVRHICGRALHSVQWHEHELRSANASIAGVKAMLIRGNYTEISLEEISASQFEQANPVKDAAE